MYIDDDFQEPTPLLSYWRKTTAQDDQDITISKDQEFKAKAARNKYWKDQLHSDQLRRLQRKPNTTTTFLSRPSTGRKHLHSALHTTTHGMTPQKARHALQALCSTFPTMHKLNLMGKAPSPDCHFCPGTHEHMCHWQCLCPQFDDSRIAAHNRIWGTLFTHIKRHAHDTWHLTAETPMASTYLHTHQRYRKWQPDGIAYNTHTGIVYLLEFTRCTDSRLTDSTLEAIERKIIKYTELADDIRNNNNTINGVEIITVAIGYLGSMDETRLTSTLQRFGLTPSQATKAIQDTITCTMAAFGTMARERTAAIALHKKGIKTAQKKTKKTKRKTGITRRRRPPRPTRHKGARP
jgi:hypothetical protein